MELIDLRKYVFIFSGLPSNKVLARKLVSSYKGKVEYQMDGNSFPRP